MEKGLTAALLDRYAARQKRFKTNKIQETRQKDVRALRYWTASLLETRLSILLEKDKHFDKNSVHRKKKRC